MKKRKFALTCMSIMLFSLTGCITITPTYSEPTYNEPTYNKPTYNEPTYNEPTYNEPTYNEPITTMQNQNMIIATVDGKEETFYLDEAYISNNTITAKYTAFNPRGEERYRMYLKLDSNISEGTYDTGSVIYSPASVTFYIKEKYSYSVAYSSNSFDNYEANPKYEKTGTFTIENISDDWYTYDGTFDVTVTKMKQSESIKIKNATFNLTIGESYE